MKETMEGLWNAYIIKTTDKNGNEYELRSKQGIRGVNISVEVVCDHNKWSVTYRGMPVEIETSVKLIKAQLGGEK